ncbi:HAD family hydrolase [Streptomyces canus]|uniref:HAD family hydrolase n=1 Tax=Streptomyces canus TaxID=58343 RepID=UPI0036A34524
MPDAGFFARVLAEAEGTPEEEVYVGDYPDKDSVPAKRAGLRTAHIQRGSWRSYGRTCQAWLDHTDWRIDRLTELPILLRACPPGGVDAPWAKATR